MTRTRKVKSGYALRRHKLLQKVFAEFAELEALDFNEGFRHIQSLEHFRFFTSSLGKANLKLYAKRGNGVPDDFQQDPDDPSIATYTLGELRGRCHWHNLYKIFVVRKGER